MQHTGIRPRAPGCLPHWVVLSALPHGGGRIQACVANCAMNVENVDDDSTQAARMMSRGSVNCASNA